MRPLKSIQARWQTYTLSHYKNSFYGRKLQKLKNIHKGERCFIVANGPSLTSGDLNMLYNNKEITFGMNRIHKFFEKTNWRPTYYVCEDELIFQESQQQINEISAKMKFIPSELHWYHGVNIEKATWFHLCYQAEKEDPKYRISTDIAQRIDARGTVTATCMQIALYMGFNQIYLLGVDHNYQRIIDENGNVIEDKNAKDYFCEDYDLNIKEQVVHDMGQNTRAYRDVKRYCDDTECAAIYNATRGGKLEVFERVDFDKLFK